MIVNGTVIKLNQNETIAKRDGGTYQGTLLVYKDARDGQIRDRAFHSRWLEYNANLANVLHSLKEGDNFEMEMNKNETGFWNVDGINKAGPGNSGNTTKANNTPSSRSSAPSYDNRQDLIIRQNCVGNAIKYHELIKTKNLTVAQVVEVATQLEDYVKNGELTPSAKGDESVQDSSYEEEDIPF